jgi:hypothetical protein
MSFETTPSFQEANRTRYRPGQSTGHYESFFVRANHPSRPLAFWIRYTIFSPHGRPHEALGEIWAIVFDGESGRHVALKSEVPFERCTFSSQELLVIVDQARLEPGKLKGRAASSRHAIEWDLAFANGSPPLLLLPAHLYERRLPRAKSLVAVPMAVFDGSLVIDGQTVDVRQWVGSQNHNWGSRHTDQYAWGQVAGFDNSPESFLEVATARLKLGPLWSPFMTPLVLRHRGRQLAVNGLRQTIRTQAAFRYFDWTFACATDDLRMEGRITAPKEAFVGLRYYNPPGGTKQCLNTKIGSCELKLIPAGGGQAETLSTKHRAAFEILTDDITHGIEIRA